MGGLDCIKRNQTCGLPFVATEESPRQQLYLPFTRTRDLLGVFQKASSSKGTNDIQVYLIHFHFSPSNKITFSTCPFPIFYAFSCFCNPAISKIKQPLCSSLRGAILATCRPEDQCPRCNMSFSCTTWRGSYISPSRACLSWRVGVTLVVETKRTSVLELFCTVCRYRAGSFSGMPYTHSHHTYKSSCKIWLLNSLVSLELE